MEKLIKYQYKSPAKQMPALQPSQTNLFTQKALNQVTVKKEKKPVPPVTLNTYILFGRNKGSLVKEVLFDETFLRWYANQTHTTLSKEVTDSILSFKNLAR